MDNKNWIIIENFVREVSYEEADEILKSIPRDELGLIMEYGAIIQKSAKYVLEYAEDGKCYFATIGMLERSKDGVVVALKHEVGEVIDNIPEFKDIFTMKEFKF